MTIEALLFTSLMKNAKILAGNNGIFRSVTWCALDNVIDFDSWVMPGTLIMHTGVNNSSDAMTYVKFMHEQESAGILLLNDGDMTCGEVIDYCNENNLPLIKLPSNTNIINFTRRISTILSNDVNEEERSEEWLKELCFSGENNCNEVVAEYYGYNSEADYTCVCMEMTNLKDLSEISAEHELNRTRAYLVEKLGVDQIRPLSFINKNLIACFIPRYLTESTVGFKARINDAMNGVASLYQERDWRASVGSTASSLKNLSESFYDALKTRELTTSMGNSDRIVMFDEWSLHMLLLDESKAELKRRMDSVLGPLLDDSELLETVCAYFDSDESVKETATALFIHVSTLKYRIGKIEKLLGFRLSDGEGKFRLRMALTIYKYLSHKESA